MKDFLFLLSGLFYTFLAIGQADPCAEVKIVQGEPTLFVDGSKVPPFAYMSYLGKPKYYQEMSDARVRLFNVPAYLCDQGINSTSGIGVFRPSMWIGPGQYDLSPLYKDMDEIISSAADPLIVIRIHLDPPIWWERRNKDELCLLPDLSTHRVSLFSEKWRKEAGAALKAIVEELKSDQRYSKYLLGIHVAGGMTEEWFYHYKDYFYDESMARKTAYRKWLRKQYGDSVEKLRTAWNQPRVTFDNAMLEDISGKHRTEGWRDPVEDQPFFDAFDFQAENMANNIIYFCKIVKEASDGCLLTGAFYGYHYFVTSPQRGHGALSKLLECPDLDYLSSPNDYMRVSGEDWAPMVAIGSIQMHGKLWLAENDTRTYLTTLLKEKAPEVDPGGDWYTQGVWLGPKSPELSHSLVLKNLGRMLAGGYGGWWFDMWGGWFSDSTMLSMIADGVEAVFKEDTKVHLKPEVALVVDERLSFWDKSFGQQTAHMLQNRYALGKSGTPYKLFLRTDLERLSENEYKAIWLLGIPDLNPDEQKIVKQWRSNKKAVFYTNLHSTVQFSHDAKVINYDQTVFSPEEIAEFWQSAGVHRYSAPGTVIYAGKRWLTIHSGTGGEQVIRWPGDYEVRNRFTNQLITSKNRMSQVDMKPGETYLFELEPIVD